MPILSLGNKIRQFKQLAVLQQCRLDRHNDPLSAHQHKHHRTALHLVSDILKQEWSFLLLERQFLQDNRTFTRYLTKSQVVDKLLVALEAYEKCLTHQAVDPSRVRYDLTDFERNLAEAISTVYTVGQAVLYVAVERAKTSWKCTKEYEEWRANWRDMVDPTKGKLRVKERDVPELSRLIDGDITVTFYDEDDGSLEEVPLTDTLPEMLVDHFDDAYKHVGSLELTVQPKVPKAKEAAWAMVPQGRRGLICKPKRVKKITTIRPKNVKEIDTIEFEEETDPMELCVVPETLSSVCSTLYRKEVVEVRLISKAGF
jgi:DNA-binding HxlR family transcriptional regulator